MKKRISKYIFCTIVITLLAYCIYKIYILKKENNNNISENNESSLLQDDSLNLCVIGLDSINPLVSNNKYVYDISKLIFEPLIKINENFKTEPCLAEEWSMIDEYSCIIKLRKDVMWSDNVKFSSKDVKFTIELLQNDLEKSIYKVNIDNIKNVEIIDNNTIKIYFNNKEKFFEYNLIFPIIPYHIYNNTELTNNECLPIGTGEYKISSIEKDVIVLNRNEYWWQNEKSKFNSINIFLYDTSYKAYNDFTNGKIDIMSLEESKLNDIIENVNYTYSRCLGRELEFLTFNCKSDVLKDKKVRQAIALSIDRQNIIGEIYNGNKVLTDFTILPNSWLYNNKVSIEYNPDKAKLILSNNKKNVKNKDKNSYILKLRILVNNENEKRVKLAEKIKESLENININVIINSVDSSMYKKKLEKRDYDIAIMGTSLYFSPDLELFFGDNNYANYENNEIDSILSSNDDIENSYKRIQEIFIDELPYLPLGVNNNIIIYNKKINGTLKPAWNNIYDNIKNITKNY